MGKTALYVSSLLMVWLIPLQIFAQQGVSGTQTQGQIGPEKEKACAPIGPFKEGEACYLEKVPCLDGKEGLIISRCNNKGQCVGVESCGKPLEKPTEIPDAPAPQQPSPTPDPVPGTGGPAIDDVFPGGGSVGNEGGSPAQSLPDNTLPPVDIVQPTNLPPTKPGSTFSSPAGDPFTLGPGADTGNTFGGTGDYPDGVFSGGGDLFDGIQSTFGQSSSFGGVGSGDSGVVTGFANFFSGLFNLFSGFGGGSPSPSFSSGSGQATSPRPTPTPTPTPTVRVADAGGPTPPPSSIDPEEAAEDLVRKLEEIQKGRTRSIPIDYEDSLDELLEEMRRLPLEPLPQLEDRIGLPKPSGSLLGGNRSIPGDAVKEQERNDAPPPKNNLPPPTSPGERNPWAKPLAESLQDLKDAAVQFEDRSQYDKFLDWIGVGSQEGVTLRSAEVTARDTARKWLLAEEEPSFELKNERQIAQGGPVITDADPIADLLAREGETLTPDQRAKLDRDLAAFEKEWDSAPDDATRQRLLNNTLQGIIKDVEDKIPPGSDLRKELESRGVVFSNDPPQDPARGAAEEIANRFHPPEEVTKSPPTIPKFTGDGDAVARANESKELVVALQESAKRIATRFTDGWNKFRDTVRDYTHREAPAPPAPPPAVSLDSEPSGVDRLAFGENFSGELPEVPPAESPEAPAPPAPPPAVSMDSQPPPAAENPWAESALRVYESAQSAVADRFLKFQTRFQDTVRDFVNRVDRLAFGENFSGELPEVPPAESPEAPAPPAPPPAVSTDSQPPPTSQPPQAAPPNRPSRPTPTPGNTPPPSAQMPQQPSGFSQGFVSGGFNLLGALLSALGSLFSNEENSPENGTVPPAPITTPRGEQPSAVLVANPSFILKGETTRLSWTSVGTSGCAVIDRSFKEFARSGSSGNVVSPSLEKTTRFGIVCDIKNGTDKFVAEVLVRVEGDDADPPQIFSSSGRVSEARSTSSTGSGNGNQSGSTNGSSSTGQRPIDVRTCDPEQPMNQFIQCLCEVEPNPNGCRLFP